MKRQNTQMNSVETPPAVFPIASSPPPETLPTPVSFLAAQAPLAHAATGKEPAQAAASCPVATQVSEGSTSSPTTYRVLVAQVNGVTYQSEMWGCGAAAM